MDKPITRCVCYNVSFKKLKKLAEEKDLDLEGLKDETLCCCGCTMCEPYIKQMLSTGETEFEDIW